MKKLLLFIMTMLFIVSVSAQKQRVKPPKSVLNIAAQKVMAIDETTNLQTTVNPYVSDRYPMNEVEIGNTVYDLQSNTSSPSNRIEVFSDGTIGATWTYGTGAPSYANRGTGYNYLSSQGVWGPIPTNRIETLRSGWPAYSSCGPNGEAFVSHVFTGTAPLNFYKREVKGTGAWTASTIPGPPEAPGIVWPRMTSSGPDNQILHVIALTCPTVSGGSVYNGQDGALVYLRSTDAGATWSPAQVLPGMDSEFYYAFNGDTYSITAIGDNVVILVADNWKDLFTMTSHDNGETWEKTVIWEHPIPLWNNTPSIDTIYCPDGAAHATFDRNGKVHVVFGVNRGLFEEGDTAPSWFPFVDGIAYWNEDKPTWTGGDQANVLNPDLLFENGDLIAYSVDLNGNGQLDWVCFGVDCISKYYVSPTSMPQIVVDEWDQVYVVYSAITETFNNGTQDFRHLWFNYSIDGGQTWNEQVHLTDDIIHFFDEIVFPSIAREQYAYDESIHILYQVDNEPGLSVRGDEDLPSDNLIYYSSFEKVWEGTNDMPLNERQLKVSSAYPNPFTNVTSLDVTTAVKADVSIEIYSVTGQKVRQQTYGQHPAGTFKLDVNASGLNPGLYLVKVKAGEQSSTIRINVM